MRGPRLVAWLAANCSVGLIVARRLAQRFKWHYTPKHGSWLDMAEVELAVLSSQCVDRRIGDQQALAREVEAWQIRRNTYNAKADWRFTNTPPASS